MVLPNAIKGYVRAIDTMNRVVGYAAMYLVFGIMAILLYSTISNNLFTPQQWTLETAQFAMVAYYLLGGGYTIQTDDHVRMDLLYSRWSNRTKAMIDAVTVLFLLTYLVMLLYGGLSSTEYALKYGEQSYSSWAPYMAPIKIIMVVGIVLMLLQITATFFRNLAEAVGDPLP